MIKIDLHTHSTGSVDGGISATEYRQVLHDGKLDYIAITDHDTIDTAKTIQKEIGERIIVGQEVTTLEGEIIGLYLTKQIPKRLSLKAAVAAIKDQKGLVYIPHPFETVRSGLTKQSLDSITEFVDIVEVNNGRAVFQNKGPEAVTWARLNNKVMASSSDAHGPRGLGTAYTTLDSNPNKQILVKLLQKAHRATGKVPLLSLLYPKYHRLRGKLKRK